MTTNPCVKLFIVWTRSMALAITILFSLFSIDNIYAQSYVFAQLNGTPVNTTNWIFSGAAKIQNIVYTDSSEIIVCPKINFTTGAVFFNQPINLSQCVKWVAEFDFRIYDGNGADGLAFCFLDAPPNAYVPGSGMGIPSNANGLKICFDQYANCDPPNNLIPKIEIRWGYGYDECNPQPAPQPTRDNTDGKLSFIRSDTYNHAKITYNADTIKVYVNDILYVTGVQAFNFSGYLGFTSGTGGSNDNHSIRNVSIYTDMPPSNAGDSLNGKKICSGQSINIGTVNNAAYGYNWLPSSDLNNTKISNPIITVSNPTNGDIKKTYYVSTYFQGLPACASKDSVILTIIHSASIVYKDVSVCGFGESYTLPSGKIISTTGMYRDTAHNLMGCDSLISSGIFSIDTVKQTVILDTTICSNTSYKMPSGMIVYSSGTYYDTLRYVQGCDSLITKLTLTVIFIKIASTSATICKYQFYTTPSRKKLNVAGIYSDTLRYLTGCDSLITSINLMVDTPLQVNPIIYSCKDSVRSISPGTNFVYFLWDRGDTTNSITVSQGIYSVKVTDVNGCNANDTFRVLAFAPPPVMLDKNIVLCIGQPKTIDAGSGYNSYLWSNGSTNQTTVITTTGTYWVSLKDNNTCPGSDTTIVKNVETPPFGFLPSDTTKCSFTTLILGTNTGFSYYLWGTGSTASTIKLKAAGIYALQVTDANGCIGHDSTVVSTDTTCKEYVYVPTAFSPNGDGVNDIFKPLVLGNVLQYEFLIYNRWGQKVFESKDQNGGWNGLINGLLPETGTYLWQLSIMLDDGVPISKKGTVVLIR